MDEEGHDLKGGSLETKSSPKGLTVEIFLLAAPLATRATAFTKGDLSSWAGVFITLGGQGGLPSKL
jgi:hypothetical protein